jgi:hypothetical protein
MISFEENKNITYLTTCIILREKQTDTLSERTESATMLDEKSEDQHSSEKLITTTSCRTAAF